MLRRPHRSTRTYTLFPYSTLIRSPQNTSSGSQMSARPNAKPKVLKPIDSSAQLPANTRRSAHEILLPYFCLIGHSSRRALRSEEHKSELQSLMRSSYAVFCLKKKQRDTQTKYFSSNHNIYIM